MDVRNWPWGEYVEHEYSIQLSQDRASAMAVEAERLLVAARRCVSQLPFDVEPSGFGLILLNSRDQSSG
jgi:hypothetical protein